jgi:hypothetical protein
VTDPDITPPMDPVARAASLEQAMNALGAKIGALVQYGRRNRHLIILLAISIVFDLILSVALGVVAVGAHNASDRATVATSGVKANCQTGNTVRAEEVQLWDYIIGVSNSQPPPPGRTPEQQKQIVDQFLDHLHTIFAPRDCNHLVLK